MDLLIRGGTLVDGTRAKARRADVRMKGTRISEVGADLKPAGEKVIDAGGAYVTPGFIDCHTHYDAPMFWMPSFDPQPGYGTTTTVMGNCGLSIAPMSANAPDRKRMIDVFSSIEDIPIHAFENDVPWGWQDWAQYRAAVEGNGMAPNVAGLMGHVNLRIFVMGDAAWERKANAVEIAKMAAILDEGLRHGALGISTNFFDTDTAGNPVPTLLADEAEFAALCDVMARYPGAVFQFLSDTIRQQHNAAPKIEMMCRLCRPRGVRMQYLIMPMEEIFTELREQLLDVQLRMRAEGADLWALYLPQPLKGALSLERSIVFQVQGAKVWDEVVNAETTEEKFRLMRDEDWRRRVQSDLTYSKMEGVHLHDPESYFLNQSENETGPLNLTLGEYARQTGKHHWLALADWVLANGIGSTVALKELPVNEKAVEDMLRYPFSVSGVNDAGAHGKLFCGAGETSSHLLTHYVRDKGTLSIEEVVHALTGKLADHYSFKGRGVIAPGNFADLTVFALNEIETRPSKKVHDVPNGDGGMTWRFTRPAAPMRATIVNGTLTYEHAGKGYTGELPGKYVSPEKEARSQAAD